MATSALLQSLASALCHWFIITHLNSTQRSGSEYALLLNRFTSLSQKATVSHIIVVGGSVSALLALRALTWIPPQVRVRAGTADAKTDRPGYDLRPLAMSICCSSKPSSCCNIRLLCSPSSGARFAMFHGEAE